MPRTGHSQTSLWLDAAFSSARPPAGGVQAAASNYAIVGARAEALTQPWKLSGTSTFGRTLDGDGRYWWLYGDVERWRTKAGVFLFDYTEDVDYRTAGIQLQRDIVLANGAVTLRPMLTAASWHVGLLEADYVIGGGAVQWTKAMRRYVLQATLDAFNGGDNSFARGTYASLRADAQTTLEQFTVGAAVTQARNPLRLETGYALWTMRSIGDNWQVEAQLAQTVTDPIFGSPRSLGFTVAASWRAWQRTPAVPPALAAVGEAGNRGRVVTFTVKIDAADSVAVSGTFSDWKPLKLTRSAGYWTGSFPIEPGTHQYGFLVNGDVWFVPPTATDVIDDGFGRKNVTLVVRQK